MRTRRHARATGFTLIELLVSVVIVGILAAVAAPSYATATDRAKNAAVQSNCHSVQLALEQYGVDTAGVYPRDEATFYRKVVQDESYSGSSRFPRTPWDSQQSRGIVWPQSSESVAAGDIVGAGAEVDPVRTNHYGAIAYTLAKGVTAQERYVLVGVGKRKGKAVVVASLRNF
jgi:type II secretion system protein G